jgi:hypothetical protein
VPDVEEEDEEEDDEPLLPPVPLDMNPRLDDDDDEDELQLAGRLPNWSGWQLRRSVMA